MAQQCWPEKLKAATKTCLIQDGKRKVHYTFGDGNEMVEEYDLRNYDILVRANHTRSSSYISHLARCASTAVSDFYG